MSFALQLHLPEQFKRSMCAFVIRVDGDCACVAAPWHEEERAASGILETVNELAR
jgi:hypothetical protein